MGLIFLLVLAGVALYLYGQRKAYSASDAQAAKPPLVKNPNVLAMIVLGCIALWAAFSLIHWTGYLAGGAAEPSRVLARMVVPLFVLAGTIVLAAKLFGSNPYLAGILGPFRQIVETPESKMKAKIAPGYISPLRLMNYYDPLVERKLSNGGKTHDFPYYTDDLSLLNERSNMSQFRLWYNTQDYVSRSQKNDNPAGREWVEIVDGNPQLGTDTSIMPIFLQMPVESSRKIPNNKDRYYKELGLFEVTPEQVQRLKTGPLREETFDLIRHGTRKRENWTMSVGVLGGKFREEIKLSGAGGTAKPVGLEGVSQGPPANPTHRPEESDKF